MNRTVIVGSSLSSTAPSPQTRSDGTCEWRSWSGGGDRTHDIVAGPAPQTFTARFAHPGPK